MSSGYDIAKLGGSAASEAWPCPIERITDADPKIVAPVVTRPSVANAVASHLGAHAAGQAEPSHDGQSVKPELVRDRSRIAVRLRADAPSYGAHDCIHTFGPRP